MSLLAKTKTNSSSKTFVLHPAQIEGWRALDAPDTREIALCAGIQSGKTSFGAIALMKKVYELRKKFGPCNFIVAADTYKTLHQATIPTLMKIFSKLGKHNQQKAEIQLRGGGTIFLRTGTDPWSVEGIPDCAFAWMDEAGKCSRLFQINVLGRVSRLSGQVLYTSTPYALNWFYRDVEKPFLKGDRKDIAFIRFSSEVNPSFPKEEFERQRALLDARMFRMKYMGMHERMQGLVYPDFSEGLVIPPQPIPRDAKIYAGVDFGFAEGHEFALVIRANLPGGIIWEIDEFKSAGLDPVEQVNICKAKAVTYGIKMFYCDPARPDLITLMGKAGLSATGFHVGRENYKQIVPGIQQVQQLMRGGKWRVFDRCKNLVDELETYHWPEVEEDTIVKEVPVAINDHCMDALRYVTVGTMSVELKEEVGYRPRLPTKRDFFNPAKVKSSKSWNDY